MRMELRSMSLEVLDMSFEDGLQVRLVRIVQNPPRDEMGLEQQTWQTKILFGSKVMPSQSVSPDERWCHRRNLSVILI